MTHQPSIICVAIHQYIHLRAGQHGTSNTGCSSMNLCKQQRDLLAWDSNTSHGSSCFAFFWVIVAGIVACSPHESHLFPNQ